MLFRVKRALLYFTVATYLFLSGTENAIILPTAWQYLKRVGVHQHYFLGLILAGFSASASVAGIIGGRLGDSYPQHTKSIVVLSVFCMIAGNIQYLVGGSVVNLIMGRVICGLGSGAGAALLAEVCRTSTTNERTSILSLCNGLRQIGLLTSPGFQLILEHLDFSLFHGTLMIKPYNASGLLMSGLWILFLIFVLIFYENINIEYSYELLRREHVGQDITGESLELSVSYCLLDNSEENANKSRSRQSWFYLDDIYRDTPVGLPVTWKVYLDEFIHDDTVVLFGMMFILFFCQVSVETVLPLLLFKLFGYASYETSIIYMVSGSVSIIVYLAVAFTTKWTSDTYLLTFGWAVEMFGFIWFLIWLPLISPGEVEKVQFFGIGLLLLYVGFPFVCVGASSLLTKCVSPQVQGVAQGLRRFGTFIGLILGPLWGGATVNRPVLQMAVPLTLLLIMAVTNFKHHYSH